jgi:hypothetical protein
MDGYFSKPYTGQAVGGELDLIVLYFILLNTLFIRAVGIL